MPEEAVLLDVFDLNVGKGGLAVRTPVDDTLAAVDISLFVQAAERLAHGLGALLVHGEALALPVAGRAERFKLLHNAVAVMLLPVPNTLKELFAAEIKAGQPLLAELGLHLDLRGNAGVVNARQPERTVSTHALPADEHVLNRFIERVAEMELAGDVRGRDHDGERLLVRVTHSVEPAAVRPEAVDQHRAGQRPAPVLNQQPQQLLLGFAQLDRPTCLTEIHPVKVEAERVDLHARGVRMRAPPQLGVDPGPEHGQREGLGDIIVRAGFQPRDDVHFHIVGGEQNHRHVPAPAKLRKQLQPAAVREIDIQNQQIERLPVQRAARLLQRGAEGDLHLLPLQRQLNPAAQGGVILQQEDFWHRKHLLHPPYHNTSAGESRCRFADL